MAQITIDGVSKTYAIRGHQVHAVRDLSLTVADRELLVLVGPSGCGKTTLLRLIAGLEDTSAGRVHIGGRVVNDVAPRDRNVAMVFQNHALYPHLSVYRNMAFGLEARGERRMVIEERIKEAAAMLGVTPLLTRKPATLSAGERQRVALGRAVVRRPAVFLFDEPLANLDATLRRQMQLELKRIQRRLATTMIYVTHDQNEAMSLGDRVGVLRDGVLQQVGTPEELYRLPSNRFVAGFIGSPPMSFLKATYDPDDNRIRSECHLGGFELAAPREITGTRRPVTIGIRAEDMWVANHASSVEPEVKAVANLVELPVRVDLCEPLGPHTIVHLSCTCGEELMTVLSGTPNLAVGQPTNVRFEPKNVQIFDSDKNESRLA